MSRLRGLDEEAFAKSARGNVVVLEPRDGLTLATLKGRESERDRDSERVCAQQRQCARERASERANRIATLCAADRRRGILLLSGFRVRPRRTH